MKEVENKKKRAQWLALFFLLFHFGLILVYTLPNRWFGMQSKSYAATYVRPFFNQRWNLFAPEIPSEHYTFHVRNKEGIWKELIEDMPEYKSWLYSWEWQHALFIWGYKMEHKEYYPNSPRKEGSKEIVSNILGNDEWTELQILRSGKVIFSMQNE